ncbi:selenoprotein, putative, partial [Plasmodium malariae]
LNGGEETEIYFEDDEYAADQSAVNQYAVDQSTVDQSTIDSSVYDSNNKRKKYVIFLRSIKAALFNRLICYLIVIIYILISLNIIFPRNMEAFIPTFLLNHEKFKEIFENFRKKKIWVFAAMFLSYNIIHGILCNTDKIHIYQNKNLIYNDPYIEHLFVKQLRAKLIEI